MKIAIIGSGISGLVAAYLLNEQHDVTVFESNDYVGGHTHTVTVESDGKQLAIDTGFIVFNDCTYPNFVKLLDRLGVASQPTSMSFSLRCDRTGLEYNGSSFNGLFAQRRNLVRPSFYRMLADIMRFNRESPRVLADDHENVTLEEYVRLHRYSRQFAEHYLIPMGAAIWSCPPDTFGRFPIRFVVEFYQNHGLLSLRNRPQWRTVVGGSHRYVERLTASYRDRIQLQAKVTRADRYPDGVHLDVAGQGRAGPFEHVVFACHSDQALRILDEQASPQERDVLNAFPYQRNEAILHTDTSVLPVRRRAWASWNYHIGREDTTRAATLTYNMNILQRLSSPRTFCVTLNSTAIGEQHVIGRFHYEHPVFTLQRRAAQRRHGEIDGQRRTSFCGAYWGNGFHEDGVNSALAVCRRLGMPCSRL